MLLGADVQSGHTGGQGLPGQPGWTSALPPTLFLASLLLFPFLLSLVFCFFFFLFPPVLPGLLFAGSLLFLFLIVVSRFLFSSRLLPVIGTIIFRRVHDFFQWTPCMLFLRPG